MSDQERCPKCGAAIAVQHKFRDWHCGSWKDADRGFIQSPACRIAELEAELNAARKNLKCPDDRLLSQWLMVREPPVFDLTFKAKGGDNATNT